MTYRKKDGDGAKRSKQNLIPLNKRSEGEKREIAIMGNKASIESKKNRKLFREILDDLLNESVYCEELDTKITRKQLLTLRVLEKGIETGDCKVFELVRDTNGEKPIDKRITASVSINDIIKQLEEK
jgi:U3 small nucleolar RNA-associated protein 14